MKRRILVLGIIAGVAALGAVTFLKRKKKVSRHSIDYSQTDLSRS